MKLINKMKYGFKAYLKDTAGSMASIWALSASVIIIGAGTAYDTTQISKARQLAQIAADNMALTASIAVDFNNDKRYEEGKAYSYKKLGGPAEDFTNSMVGRVEYDVVDKSDPKKDESGNIIYDKNGKKIYNKLIARATVSGEYQTAFMGIFGKKSVEFEAVSDVAYAAREGKPASIFFITDNSGSMRTTDNTGRRKIDSLKSSMKSFMKVLNSIKKPGQEDIFRTALFPYSSELLYHRVVNPKWDTLSNSQINRMRASGGTNSTSALIRARSKFNLENNIHKRENGEDKPLKFLVFMSDGGNNGAYMRQVCEMQEVWVPEQPEHWVLYWYGNEYKYYSYRWWFKYYNVRHYPKTGAGYQERQVCTDEVYSPVNEASLRECTRMKSQGVQIYTIAYDLKDYSGTRWNDKELAIEFMKKCSSGEKVYYQYAENGADLKAVFNRVGESIVKEVIRIKR